MWDLLFSSDIYHCALTWSGFQLVGLNILSMWKTKNSQQFFLIDSLITQVQSNLFWQFWSYWNSFKSHDICVCRYPATVAKCPPVGPAWQQQRALFVCLHWLWFKGPCDTVRLKETLVSHYYHNWIHLLLCHVRSCCNDFHGANRKCTMEGALFKCVGDVRSLSHTNTQTLPLL